MERNNQTQDIYGMKNSRFSPEERAKMVQDNEKYRESHNSQRSPKKSSAARRVSRSTSSEKPALSRNERIKTSAQNRKKQKKIQNNLIIAMLMAVAIGLIGAFLSFAMQINTIEITGSERYSDKSVLAAAGLETGDSMLLMNIAAGESRIESGLPFIENAEISRKWPDKVIITLEDAVPTLAVDTGNGYILMNNSCKVLDTDAVVVGSAALIRGVTVEKAVEGQPAVFSSEVSRESFVALCNAFAEYGIEKISEYNLTAASDIVVVIDYRIEVRLGTLAGAVQKLAFCKAVIDKTVESDSKHPMIIDVTADGKAYARRKSDNNVVFNEPTEPPAQEEQSLPSDEAVTEEETYLSVG